MELVETIEVGAGGAASIEFTSIPQDADDLLLVVSAISGLTYGLEIYFNSDTNTANYTTRLLAGTGTSVSSSTTTPPYLLGGPSSYGAPSNSQLYVPNYTGSVAKSLSIDSVTSRTTTGSVRLEIQAGRWSGTSAITTIKLQPSFVQSFAQYSIASLYKITKA